MYKSHKHYKWGRVGLGSGHLTSGPRRKKNKSLGSRKSIAKGAKILLRKKGNKTETGKKTEEEPKIRKIGTFGELLLEALKKHSLSGEHGQT